MRVRKSIFSAVLVAVILASSFNSEAQQPGKIYRIGYLSNSLRVNSGFREALREIGYVEGQNLVIEWRAAKGKLDLLPKLAAELVRLNLDCIVSFGVNPTRAVKQASHTIPIVMGNADDDPVRQGLVASLAQPGGNVTGFTNIGSELAGKRLELLKETVPKISRVAILWDPKGRGGTGHIGETGLAAPKLGVQLQPLEVRGPEFLENTFRAAENGRAEALIVVATGLMNSHRPRIVELAVKARLPAMYSNLEFVRAGGLMSYDADAPERYRRIAIYVDRILKGAKPADLPVERPTKFEFIINLKAAKQIGVTIPPGVLARADRVMR